MRLHQNLGETLESYEKRLKVQFMRHPSCKPGHIAKLQRRTTPKKRLQYLRGTLNRWHKEAKAKRLFRNSFVQGGLVNPR